MIIVDVHTPFFFDPQSTYFLFSSFPLPRDRQSLHQVSPVLHPHLAEVERASSLTHRFLKVSVVTLHPGGLLACGCIQKIDGLQIRLIDWYIHPVIWSSEPPSQMAVSASLRPLQSCEEYKGSASVLDARTNRTSRRIADLALSKS